MPDQVKIQKPPPAGAVRPGGGPERPEETTPLPKNLAVMPLRDAVLFPGIIQPLTVGRKRSLALVQDVMLGDRVFCVVTQKQASQDEPAADDLYGVGCAVRVLKLMRLPDDSQTVIVQALAACGSRSSRRRPRITGPTRRRCPTSGSRDRVRCPGGDGPAPDQPHHRTLAQRASGSGGHGGLDRVARPTGRFHRRQHEPRHGPQAGPPGRAPRGRTPAHHHRTDAARNPGPGTGLENPERGARPHRGNPARILPPRADEEHPEGTGREGREDGRSSSNSAKTSTPPTCPKRSRPRPTAN